MEPQTIIVCMFILSWVVVSVAIVGTFILAVGQVCDLLNGTYDVPQSNLTQQD